MNGFSESIRSKVERGMKGQELVEVVMEWKSVVNKVAKCELGKFLPIQLLYQGKTERVHPQYKFPEGFDVWHTHNHWASQQTTLRYLEKIIIPYIQ